MNLNLCIKRTASLLLTALLFVLFACSTAGPQLKRLYQTAEPLPDQPPVILVHGVFGGRLCDRSGKEQWPGNLTFQDNLLHILLSR